MTPSDYIARVGRMAQDAETENSTYFRVARIEIKVTKDWLTVDGEYSNEDEAGWHELERAITNAIHGCFSGPKFPARPQIEWLEWEDAETE